MKICEAIFLFNGWKFLFTPDGKQKMNGRIYTKWKVVVEHKGEKYITHYLAFVPSAHICRVIKKSKNFLDNKISTSK